MLPIRAIETVYDGHRFRSRLEARWAVVFKTLGVEYLYELEGFHLPSGPYLPDFFLPWKRKPRFEAGFPQMSGYYVETKPAPLSEKEQRLLRELADATHHRSLAFCGTPNLETFKIYDAHPCNDKVIVYEPRGQEKAVPAELLRRLHRCEDRNDYGDDYSAVVAEIESYHSFWAPDILTFIFWAVSQKDFTEFGKALSRALQARFEYGEKPT